MSMVACIAEKGFYTKMARVGLTDQLVMCICFMSGMLDFLNHNILNIVYKDETINKYSYPNSPRISNRS
jgi:hypothetical protein